MPCCGRSSGVSSIGSSNFSAFSQVNCGCNQTTLGALQNFGQSPQPCPVPPASFCLNQIFVKGCNQPKCPGPCCSCKK